MRQSPILSSLELSILGHIREQPQSGYSLRKTLAASPGAVYPALRRLAEGGLIEGKEEATGQRMRETFHVTAAGRRALRESLQRPALEEVRRDPQAVAERLRFLDDSAAAAFVEEYGRLSGIVAAELRDQTGLAAEHDAALYAARARWAATAAKRLTRRGA